MLYLIHFDRPYKHAAHYLGYCGDRPGALDARLAMHRAGTGANLLRVVAAAGIGWGVVRTWPGGSRTDERRIKTARHTPRYCPICRAARKKSPKEEVASCPTP